MEIEIKKGTWRYVILLPFLGIAIKLPRIYLTEAWDVIIFTLGCKGWWRIELFKNDVYTYSSLKGWLFKGMVNNWLEYKFYIQTKHPFCVPTYLSLLGLINIQRLVTISQFDDLDLGYQLKLILGKADVHHWGNPSNFTFETGRLQILDYGDPEVQAAIRKYGQKIQDNFDPNYSWEKRKRELEEARR